MPTIPFRIAPMLATLVDKPFSRPNWIFEQKYDGIRLLAYKEGRNVALISRNAIDRTAHYPQIAAALAKLKAQTLALDGELVMFDQKNISRFQLWQQGKGPAFYVIFDCLYVNGEDLRKKPLSARREALLRVVKPAGPLMLSESLGADGPKAFQAASKRGLEGVIGKDLASTYVEGRSANWVKVKAHQEDEFVIGGFTPPSGTRMHFGALLLGAYAHGKLQYVGKVGTGFNDKTLASLFGKFRALVRKDSPFATTVKEKGATFIEPRLVAQVSYTEWTDEGKLRHPVFLGLRDDKAARDVLRPGA
jgi:bifunctional non-homologous end joining protein LigD